MKWAGNVLKYVKFKEYVHFHVSLTAVLANIFCFIS
jgi:hypothetical protein